MKTNNSIRLAARLLSFILITWYTYMSYYMNYIKYPIYQCGVLNALHDCMQTACFTEIWITQWLHLNIQLHACGTAGPHASGLHAWMTESWISPRVCGPWLIYLHFHTPRMLFPDTPQLSDGVSDLLPKQETNLMLFQLIQSKAINLELYLNSLFWIYLTLSFPLDAWQ